MREQLEAKGWKMYYECNCPAGKKEYFKKKEKPGYEIRVRVKSKTFGILLNNQVIAGPFHGYMLEEKLNQYVQ